MSLPHTARLSVRVPPALLQELTGKLHYVSPDLDRFEVDPSGEAVRFAVRPGREPEAGRLGRAIAGAAERLCAGYRELEEKTLVDRADRPCRFAADPHPALERAGQLHRYGPGRYGLGPLVVRLMEAFDRAVVGLAREVGAEPRQFPALIGADLMHRCRYLQAFPQAVNLVYHLKPDLGAIQQFAAAAHWTGTELPVPPDALDAARCLLASTVCFHCYGWHADSVLPADRAVTAVGKCFRYEAGALTGLERLWDFTMRELIFLGSAEHVRRRRADLIDRTARLLDEWELAYQIKTAHDPFFIDTFGPQATFQRAMDLKFEIQAVLPYRAGRPLAVGSFNDTQDFFGRSLNITLADGTPASTACVGYGLERLALAVVAQHGPEPAGWPAAVARACQP